MNYLINKPYPKIQNIQPNPQYASMMLSNLGGLHSEMNAVSLYFYNHIILMKQFSKKLVHRIFYTAHKDS